MDFKVVLFYQNFTNFSIPYDILTLFKSTTRLTILWVFIVLTTLSIIANCAVIYTMSRKNYRVIQKTCVISLALSDLLSSVSIGANNISTLAQPPMIWTLGSFLCKFLPMSQIVGILASSIALTFIAMDRYRSVVYALNKNWNPSLFVCLGVACLTWLTCFGASYKMYTSYKYCYPLCFMNESKIVLREFYLIMVFIIFLPLLCIFIWFYYKIAVLIWKHRRPIFRKFDTQESSSSSQAPKSLNLPKTQDDVRVGRKIRTIKIIVALMAVFILFRLPYFVFQILKYFDTPLSDSNEIWYMQFSFLALHILNGILNPLLYTYLNYTIKAWLKIKNFVNEVCCFCCSKNEFESFERENPFIIGKEGNKKKSSIKIVEKRY